MICYWKYATEKKMQPKNVGNKTHYFVKMLPKLHVITENASIYEAFFKRKKFHELYHMWEGGLKVI